MPTKKKEKFVILVPKTDTGKEKLSYHGDKWIIRSLSKDVKFVRTREENYGLISRDGKKFMFVGKENDPDFAVREI